MLVGCALTSCSVTLPSSSGSSSSSSSDSSSLRLVSKDQYLVDYSKEFGKDFYLAHGYKNGYPFNCYWSREAGYLENDALNLKLYKEGDRYYGAEYRSRQGNFHYGYYAVCMKAARCNGTISSFFTYTHYPVWDEIDIEFLGKNFAQVQFNYYTNGVGGHEYLHDLGFDATADFHEYGFEWLKDSITWYVDGVKIHTATENLPSHPQYLMMNLWNCIGHDEWSGPFDESKLPVTAQYKYIAYIPA